MSSMSAAAAWNNSFSHKVPLIVGENEIFDYFICHFHKIQFSQISNSSNKFVYNDSNFLELQLIWRCIFSPQTFPKLIRFEFSRRRAMTLQMSAAHIDPHRRTQGCNINSQPQRMTSKFSQITNSHLDYVLKHPIIETKKAQQYLFKWDVLIPGKKKSNTIFHYWRNQKNITIDNFEKWHKSLPNNEIVHS